MADRNQYIEELLDTMQMLRRGVSAVPKETETAITTSQWMVIGHISRNEGCTTTDVAAALHMSGSAVTQLTNGLVEKGYIKREPNPADRRAHRLLLSAESKKKIQSFKKKRVGLILEMFEPLSDAEFEQYVALNKKILKAIKKKHEK